MTRPAPTVTVPRDDDQRPFSDSLLPEAMIYAGSDALDRAQMDMANYVSGETIDWDQGMIAVAVYRAMLAAAPAAPQAAGVGEDELIDRGLRMIRSHDAVRYLRDALSATTARLTGYDWNADPDGVTKQQGDAFSAADRVFADLDAAVASHPEIELPECQACGGTGKIEEAARTEGANQHSACVRTCDDCDGCGFAPDDEPEPLRAPSREPEGGAVGLIQSAIDGILKAPEGVITDTIWTADAAPMTVVDALLLAQAALATREEAPADPCASHKAEGISLDPCCPTCEAPAEAEELAQAIKHLTEMSELETVYGQLSRNLRVVLSALRAQPQAREDAQPVAWRWKTPIQHVGDGTRWGWTFASHPSTPPASINPEPLYTHPAPDALRVAVEASGFLLDRLKDLEQDVNERDFYGHVHPAAARLRLAIAALQAEQGAK